MLRLNLALNPQTQTIGSPSLPGHIHGIATTDTGYNNPIGFDEIWAALARAKNGKATGYDQLPVEVLRNRTAVKFMHALCNVCFNKGKVSSVWSKGIINPIPKNGNTDNRSPLNYRGITLAPAMYTLYCSVLNNRLQIWSCENNLIKD